MIGQTIAGYEVLDELGAGGMGIVYRARHRRLGRLVALKRLPPQQVDDADRRRRFLEEARAVSALNHPGIVTVHDVIEHDGDDIIVMELVDGASLARTIPATGLPWRRAAALALELSDAMAAAHAAGIVHRDLKPANVMVATEASGGRLKVLDFGIAKRLPALDGAANAPRRDAPAQPPLTELGQQPGTPAYMAPEQLLGETVDHRTDIFSFGMLLYEMLTGKRPFHGPNAVALVDDLLHGEPPSLRQLRPEVPRALAALVEQALAKGPERRPQSMAEVGHGLRALIAPEMSQQQPTATPGRHLMTLVTMRRPETTLLGDVETATLDPTLDIDRLIQGHGGVVIDSQAGRTGLFELPWGGVRFAIAWQRALAEHQAVTGAGMDGRMAVHLGEVSRGEPTKDDDVDIDPAALLMAQRLAALAGRRQILLSRVAFDLARLGAGQKDAGIDHLRWLAHGDYQLDNGEVTEVFEVGLAEVAPCEAPADSAAGRRVISQGKILGWRPAPGLGIPQRPNWVIERKLGEGGFGEVWLARQGKTDEARVFKFCYEAERLRSLQREITVFLLLKEELGERRDIARLIDWNLEKAPYFIESAYTSGGNLEEWSRSRGGLTDVTLADRLELMAQVATALEAAHSVGVLHKDIKPANVLITEPPEGPPRAVLTDFGIGQILDRQRLRSHGITAFGWVTGATAEDPTQQAGTHLYMAPELLTGRPPSIQSDLYALGVMLYQVTVADLARPLAAGWERDVDDELLRRDIADCVDGLPDHRPRSASQVAEQLRALDSRHAARQAEERALRAAAEAEAETLAAVSRAARRRRLLAATALVSSLFLIVVSFLAWQAIVARAEAERDRAQAEQLIDVLLGDLHGSLEKIGRLDLLEQAARGSQSYFEALDHRQEPYEVTVKRGITLLNIGDVLLQQGDTEAALTSFEDAQTLFVSADGSESSGTDLSDPFDARDGQRRSQLRLAFALSRQGDSRAALAAAQDALRATSLLAAAEPEAARWQLGLAECQYWICFFEDQAGHRQTALESCQKSLGHLAELDSSATPEDLPWRQALLTLDGHIMIGGMQRVLKRSDAAFETYGRAQRLAERLAQRDPANAHWPQKLAWIHFQTGVLRLFHQQDLAAAYADLSAARQAYDQLSRADPTQTRWRDNLAETLNLLGRIELQRQQTQAAIDLFGRSSALLAQLVAEDPSRRSRLGALARIHQSMGRAQTQGGALDDAVESFAVAVDLNTRLAEVAGDEPDPQNFLSWSHVVLGDGYALQGQPELARRAWHRAVEIIAPITAISDAIEYRDTHAQALLKLGRIEDAEPMVVGLLADGWHDALFLEAVKRAGLEKHLP